ncbi:HAD hydrolase-like protein [Prochlorococcus marinus]|uniref:HAD hydrolase-like protein n=1 Tax=Prochlorococcus marinus TaxID=1219 RepID=UPI0022B2C283|nr:HAD hydrolase-like protein [Prochlorococcus marinus]
MNNLIIFDLDGVLIDSKDIHYNSLNKALSDIDQKYVIDRESHIKKFDGLPTMEKLAILSSTINLPIDSHQKIFEEKQEYTFNEFSMLKEDNLLKELCVNIKNRGIKIAVASNCIRKSVQIALLRIGIIEHIDYIVSSEDVYRKKPFPECYWKCMVACNSIPSSTVIFEDSHVGRQAAKKSKSHLIPVESRKKLNLELVKTAFNLLDSIPSLPWIDPKLNILIPMAGEGSRFSNAGYTFPKPLIEVNNKPMIQIVTENLAINGQFTYIVKEDHYKKYNLNYLMELISPGCNIVQVKEKTEGAACTTLLAKDLINNENPLLIANSDQYIEWDSQECMYYFSDPSIDAGILTFKATHPKWSYARVNDDGLVKEVAEKKPISKNATVGIYYWKRGSDYVKYAEKMIQKNIRTNNEFYVCPVFNEAIEDGLNVKIFEVDKMWGIGTPEDLKVFLEEGIT